MLDSGKVLKNESNMYPDLKNIAGPGDKTYKWDNDKDHKRGTD